MIKKPKLLKLSQIALFRPIPRAELSALTKKYKIWKAPAGSTVLDEGSVGDEFYVILHGEVEIVRALNTPEESHLGLRMPGEFIGEVGLLNQEVKRTATARAVSDATLLTIKYTDFSKLLKRYPELAYELARVLGSRISEGLNETIHNLQDKNIKLQEAYDELKEAQAQIVEKEKLEHSLKVASRIQYSILPMQIPQMDGYDIGALMKPAQAVGGDFFGVYPLDNRRMALIVGDVSDKGMPAAIFMAQTHALLRVSIESGESPTQSLNRVNSLLLEMNAQGMFVTVIYGILNQESGEFIYARAGHDLPLILKPDGNIFVPQKSPGMALGIFTDIKISDQTVVIPNGGFMLLSSDGVEDCIAPDGSRFEKERVHETIKQFAPELSAQATCNSIYETLTGFRSTAPQFDDVTLLAVKRT